MLAAKILILVFLTTAFLTYRINATHLHHGLEKSLASLLNTSCTVVLLSLDQNFIQESKPSVKKSKRLDLPYLKSLGNTVQSNSSENYSFPHEVLPFFNAHLVYTCSIYYSQPHGVMENIVGGEEGALIQTPVFAISRGKMEIRPLTPSSPCFIGISHLSNVRSISEFLRQPKRNFVHLSIFVL